MSVWAFADIHGRKDLFDLMMEKIGPEDKVYFLGDAADRGEDGWEIIKACIDDPRITYLKGNHEAMFLDNYGNYDGCHLDLDDIGLSWDDHSYTWYYNGGISTETAFIKDPIPGNEKVRYIKEMKNLPFLAVYHNALGENVILSHAGCDPEDADIWEEKDFLWDRLHYKDNHWSGDDKTVIVHGHTPIELLIHDQMKVAEFYNIDLSLFPKIEDIDGAYWYAGGHKCCIDCGSVWSGRSVLLNLDTWDEEIFEIVKEDNN